MKFLVYHLSDMDGWAGNAIGQKNLLGILEAFNEEEAKEWAKKHTHKVVYDIPYDELCMGEIVVEPCNNIGSFTVNDCPWSQDDLDLFNYLEKHPGKYYEYHFVNDDIEDQYPDDQYDDWDTEEEDCQ